MIVGTTSQLPIILLVVGIGVAIAVLMHFIRKRSLKFLVGGFLSLAAFGLLVWRIIDNIQKNGFYFGILGFALLGVFLLVLAVCLFWSVRHEH